MTELATPEKVIDYSKLDAKAKLEAFIEATKQGDDFKDIDIAKELNIKVAPEVDTKAVKNQEEVDKTLIEYEKSRSKLIDLGHKFPTSAKMSEAEQVIYDKVEKQSQASLSEKITELTKLDADFPSEEVLSKMSIGTEEKIIVAAGYKEMIVRNQEAVSKIKKELDVATTELKDAKLASPQKEKEDKSGEEKVLAKMSEFGLTLPKKDQPDNKDKTD